MALCGSATLLLLLLLVVSCRKLSSFFNLTFFSFSFCIFQFFALLTHFNRSSKWITECLPSINLKNTVHKLISTPSYLFCSCYCYWKVLKEFANYICQEIKSDLKRKSRLKIRLTSRALAAAKLLVRDVEPNIDSTDINGRTRSEVPSQNCASYWTLSSNQSLIRRKRKQFIFIFCTF